MIEFIKENIKTLKELIAEAKENNYTKSIEEWSKDLQKFEDLLKIVEGFEELKDLINLDPNDYNTVIINFKKSNSVHKIIEVINVYIPF